ncbi:DUF1292 domain-containing protein [Brevibacillus porteri]|uniref:DUF1292 domain-containing protein n=1 Tax=Brevibacillus porteri TaxID=2126350 RepID=UPI00363D6E43
MDREGKVIRLFASPGKKRYDGTEYEYQHKDVNTLTEENKDLELGDIITLDDENGEPLGDFEVLAMFDLNGKEYIALAEAVEDEESEEDEEVDIFVFQVDGGEMVPLEEDEESTVYAKLNEVLEGIELIKEDK